MGSREQWGGDCYVCMKYDDMEVFGWEAGRGRGLHVGCIWGKCR